MTDVVTTSEFHSTHWTILDAFPHRVGSTDSSVGLSMQMP